MRPETSKETTKGNEGKKERKRDPWPYGIGALRGGLPFLVLYRLPWGPAQAVALSPLALALPTVLEFLVLYEGQDCGMGRSPL